MKITIQEDASLPEVEVIVRCPCADGEVLRLLDGLRAAAGQKLLGLKDGKTFLLDAADALYFDVADRRTFLYTSGDVYESPLRLYELEELLAGRAFCRASKSAILNLQKIKSLAPDFGGRLEVVLENGERLNISRQYAAAIKKRLGISRKVVSE